ncbi:MAG TPA: Ig-like domain-containing protein [Bacteroidales bacterium]|nr:Ig-like domain-containing protein [Bacteroidales bacterium]
MKRTIRFMFFFFLLLMTPVLLFAEGPTLSSVSIASNNSVLTQAKVGDKIMLTFTGSEPLTSKPTVTILGHIIANENVVNTSGNTWTAEYTTLNSDTEGTVPFTINYTDIAGNAGIAVTTVTDGSSVTFDRTLPTLSNVNIASNNSVLTQAKVGDKIMLTFTGSEPLTSKPTVTILGHIIANENVVNTSGNTWTAEYTTLNSDTEGTVPFTINYTDIAGNAGIAVTTDGSSVTFDRTAPTVIISSSAANPTNVSPIPLTITFSEDVTGFVVEDITTSGGSLSGFSGSGKVYTVNYFPVYGTNNINIAANKVIDIASNGNIAASQFSIEYYKTPEVEFVSGDTICANETVVNLSATAKDNRGTIYWYTEVTGGTHVASGNNYSPNITTTTSYYVEVNDHGFISSPRIKVDAIVYPLPLTTATNTGPVCEGSAISLVGGPITPDIVNYSWTSTPAGYTNSYHSPLLSSNATEGLSKTYTLKTTDIHGCVNTASTVVTVNATPTIYNVTGGGAYCAGGPGMSIGLDGADKNTTYTLKRGITPVATYNSGTNTSAFTFGTFTQAGEYTVVATSSCTANMNGSVNITVNSLPTVYAFNNSPICAENSLVLNALPSGLNSYSWTGPAISGSLSGQSITLTNAGAVSHSGTYTLTVTDDNGCVNTATTVAKVNALPSPSIVGLDSAYKTTDSNIELVGDPSGGTFSGLGVISSINKFFPNLVSKIGESFDIKYTYTDEKNCTKVAKQSVVVLKTSAIFESINPNSTYCYTDTSDEIWAKSPDIVGNGYYKHSKKHGLQDLGNNHAILTPSLMGAGNDTITFFFKTVAGDDKISRVVFIDSVGTISINTPADEFCENDNQTVTLKTVNAGTNGTKNWIWPGTVVNGDYTFVPSSLTKNTSYNFSVTYVSTNGCSSNTADTDIFINEKPNDTIYNEKTFNVYNEAEELKGGKVFPLYSFSAPKGITYDGSVYKFNPAVVPANTSVVVTYSYTDNKSCTNTATKTFNIYSPVGTITNLGSAKDTFCYGEAIAHYKFTTTSPYSALLFYIDNKDYTSQLSGNEVTFPIGSDIGQGLHTARFLYKNGHSWFEVSKTFYVEKAVAGTFVINYANGKDYACQADNNVIITVNGYAPVGPASSFSWTNALNTTISRAEISTQNAGSIPFSYVYISPFGCHSDPIAGSVTIKALPQDKLGVGTIYNLADGAKPLKGSGDVNIIDQKFNGKFVTQGTSGYIFSPTYATTMKDSIAIFYTYSDKTTGCSNTTTEYFKVLEATETIEDALPANRHYCYTDNLEARFTLKNIQEGSNNRNFELKGTDNIKSVDGNIVTVSINNTGFSKGIKTDTLIYTYKIDTVKFSVFKIFSIDNVSASLNFGVKDSFCTNGNDFVMLSFADNSYSPVGGTFTWYSSDPALLNSAGTAATFDPSKAIISSSKSYNANFYYDTLRVYYTSPGGCHSNVLQKIYKISSPTTLTFGSGFIHNYNKDGAEIKLNAMPNGGTYYSGTLNIRYDKTEDAYYLNPQSSVVDNNQKITYSFVNNAGCNSSVTELINIIKTEGFLSKNGTSNDLPVIFCYTEAPFNIYGIAGNNKGPASKDTLYGEGVTYLQDNVALFSPSAVIDSDTTDATTKTIRITYEYTGNDADATRFKVFKDVTVDKVGKLTVELDSNYCYSSKLQTIKASCETRGSGNIYLNYKAKNYGFANNGFSANFYSDTLINKKVVEYGAPAIVTFVMESNKGCKDSVKKVFRVRETPQTRLRVPDLCFNEGKPIYIYDSTTNMLKDKIVEWVWKFGDNSKDSVSNIFSRIMAHNYSGTGQKTIRLTQTTQYNCVGYDETTINLGLKPSSIFNWVDECSAKDGSSKAIHFTDKSTAPDGDPIKKRYWSVNSENGKILYNDSTTNNYKDIAFTQPGNYQVQLRVVTQKNCIDTATKIFHLRPWVIVADDMPYSENFENGNNGWYPSLSGSIDNTIWKLGESETFGTPEGERKVWYTENTGLSNINASVTGPCMDFSWIKKPMIKLNIKKLMLQGYDGAVLQYTTDITDTVWNNLGTVSEGINWFNSNSIEGKPGNTFTGWTGKNSEDEYVSAMLNLDNLKWQPYVRLRMAYGKKNTGAQGIAFDNVWIGNRSKVLMVEGFTSASLTDDLGNNLNNYNGFDMLEMRYHTEGDDFYEQYSSGPNARSLYYKLSDFPAYIADGRIVYSPNSDTLSKKILQASKFDISLKTEKSNAGITLKVTITPLETINAEVINLHVAVVEDSATITGSNVVYRNVVRKLLPDPSGTRITHWQVGVAQEYDFSWLYYAGINPDKVKIIAFIQDSKTKEIYQAATDDAVFNKTDVKEMNILPGTISLYPNPANNYVYLLLNQSSRMLCTVQVFNNMGMLVDKTNFSPQSQMIQLNTQNYKNGVYFIKVFGSDKVFKTGKLIVTHK